MTDERIREYARRARATQDPATELRAWVEARRAGVLAPAAGELVDRLLARELDRERLALAAYAGDPAALALLGEHVAEYAAFVGDLEAVHVVFGDEDLSYADIEGWFLGLGRWEREAALATRLGVASALLARILRVPLGPEPVDEGERYEWREWREIRAELAEVVPEAVAAAERFLHGSPAEGRRALEGASRISGYSWHYPVGEIARSLRFVVAADVEEESSAIRVCERAGVAATDLARAAKGRVARYALRVQDRPFAT